MFQRQNIQVGFRISHNSFDLFSGIFFFASFSIRIKGSSFEYITKESSSAFMENEDNQELSEGM